MPHRRQTGNNPTNIHNNRTAFLSLRTRTKIDRISASVKKPKRVIPLNAPTGWRQLPLSIKIPMLKFPTGMLTFTRQKVGRYIFKSNVTDDFDLSDPYCLDVQYDYEPLHDYNMKNFTCKSENLKLFQQRGLIDESGEVLCTLKQFNNYRRYLKRQICTEVRQIGAVEDELTRDRLNYQRVMAKIKNRFTHFHSKQLRAKSRTEKRQKIDEKRQEKLATAQQKYAQQLEKYEEAQKRKQLDIEMESKWRQRLNDSRRDVIAEMEKFRAIMLKRKFAATEESVRQRLNEQREKRVAERKQQTAANFAAKMEWRNEKHIHDTHLIQLNEEISKYNQMMINRKINATRQSDKFGIAAKRAALIRNRYEKRGVNEIYQALWHCVRTYDESQNLNDSSDIESEPKPWDVISLCSIDGLMRRKSTQASIENVCDIDDKRMQQQLALGGGNTSVSQELYDGIDDDDLLSTDLMGGVSKRIIPYEPAELRFKGLIEPQYGINSLTSDCVQRAVNASYQKFIDLQLPLTTLSILFESMKFLRRIAIGFTENLPCDTAVVEFVQIYVHEMYENIIQLHLDKYENSGRLFSASQLCCWPGGICKKKASLTKHIRFNDNIEIIDAPEESSSDGESNCSCIDYKPTKECGTEKYPTLQALAKRVFNTPDLIDLPAIPDDMNTKPLAHLYKYQKYLILENLNRFEKFVLIKVRHLLEMKCSAVNECKDLEAVINYGIKSVLTLPEYDMKFGYHVTEMAKTICCEINREILSM